MSTIDTATSTLGGTPGTKDDTNQDDVVEEEELLTIWDCNKIERFSDDNGCKRWRCLWCNCTFGQWNATKALAHVAKVRGCHVAVCTAKIDGVYLQRYKKLRSGSDSKRKSKEMYDDVVDVTLESYNNDAASALEKKKRKKVPESVAVGPTKEKIQLTLTGEGNPLAESKLTMAIAHFIHAGGLPWSTASNPNFRKIISLARGVGSDYKPPCRNQISGNLLDLNYEQLMKEQMKKLLTDVDIFGVTFLGDGATVKKMPLTNVLASSPHNPVCVLEIADASTHMANGGKKDARYISSLFRPYIDTVEEQHPNTVDVVFFDGAANVQKAGEVLAGTYPRIMSLHGAEHVISLWFNFVFSQPYIKAIFYVYRRCYNVFGSGAMHAPHAIFQKYSLVHNRGENVGLIKEAGTRMAGCFIALMRLLRLKEPMLSTINSIEFSNLKVRKKERVVIVF